MTGTRVATFATDVHDSCRNCPCLRLTFPVAFIYHTTSPYTVQMVMMCPTRGVGVLWTFPRDILRYALAGRVGGERGDVTTWCTPEQGIRIRLDNGRDDAKTYDLPRSALQVFISATDRLVAPGRESDFLDLDAEFAQLLGGGH